MKNLSDPGSSIRRKASHVMLIISILMLGVVLYMIHIFSLRQQEKFDQEMLIRKTLVKSDVAAAVLDEDGKIEMVTPALLKISGYSEADLLGNPPDRLMPAAYRAAHTKGYQDRNKGEGRNHPIYCQLKRKDGTTFPIISHAYTYDKGGIAIITPADAHDLQERLFTMARTEARVGVWWWEIDQDLLIWDKVMYELFGVDDATWTPSYEGFQQGVHPEDLPWVNAVVYRCIANRSSYRAVFRVIKKSTGATIYVRAYGSVMEGLSGPVFGGVNIEVTQDEYTGAAEEIPRDPGEDVK